MKKIFIASLLILFCHLSSLGGEVPFQTRAGAGGLAILGGAIIDGTGHEIIEDGVILIEKDRISRVGKKSQVALPKGIRTIDAAGKTIVPGLMDANVHLIMGSSLDFFGRYEGRFEDLAEEAAQITLRNGCTTVFDTWGPLGPLLNVRDKISRGETAGSRVFVGGNIVGFSGPFGQDFFGDPGIFVARSFTVRINTLWEENVGPDLGYLTPVQVREEIRKYVSRGIDFIKYAASGHSLYGMKILVFSEDVQRAIVEEAHRAGLTAQAHTSSNESLRTAVEAGIDLITHADVTGPVPIADSNISLIRSKKTCCGILPATRKRQKGEDEHAGLLPFDPPTIRAWRENWPKLIKAGIPIVSSTDGYLAEEELKKQWAWARIDDDAQSLDGGIFLRCSALVEMGITPMEAIQSATRNVAAAYGKLGDIGTLESGKFADLLILDGNPLDDINNLRKISSIIQGGKIIDRDKLPIRKILTDWKRRR